MSELIADIYEASYQPSLWPKVTRNDKCQNVRGHPENSLRSLFYPTDFPSGHECVAADWFTVEFKWWVRILRKIAANELDTLGDTATLAEPAVVEDLIENRANK